VHTSQTTFKKKATRTALGNPDLTRARNACPRNTRNTNPDLTRARDARNPDLTRARNARNTRNARCFLDLQAADSCYDSCG